MAASVIPQTTPRLKNILFTTDFSEGSLAALAHAGALVRAFGATLRLCHIESRAPLAAGLADPHLYEEAGKDAVRRLDSLRLLPELKGLKPSLVLGEGDLKTELLRIVHESDVDLLVAGTRARTGLSKMLLGSVIEEICRTVTCPILTVGPEISNQPAGQYQHIIFPTNLSELSEKAVPYIALLAKKFGSQITVLHVLPGDQKSNDDTTRNAMSRQFAALSPFQAEFVVAHGNTAETVLRVAQEKKAGLIALGIRNAFRPGILRERTAYRIIAGAQCPVLTVR